MTVQELIDRLADEAPDAEVRIQYQPTYPLQAHIRGVWVDDQTEDADGEAVTPTGIVYVVESAQVHDTPYGHRAAFEEAY